MICLFKSLHPYHLLIQQDKPLPDDPVVMVMPEEPVSEPAPLPDLLQKLCEGIRGGPAPQQLVLDAGGGAVGDDVVHPPSRPLQIDTGLPVFLRSGQFLLPPGTAVDPKGCVSGLEAPELLIKQRVIRLQDAVLDIMAARSPHGEHALASKFEYLAPLQQEHRGPDAPDRSAVPPLQRIGIQGIIVLVIAGHEQGGERPSLQEVQPSPSWLSPYHTPPKSPQINTKSSLVSRSCSGNRSGRNLRKSPWVSPVIYSATIIRSFCKLSFLSGQAGHAVVELGEVASCSPLPAPCLFHFPPFSSS